MIDPRLHEALDGERDPAELSADLRRMLEGTDETR